MIAGKLLSCFTIGLSALAGLVHAHPVSFPITSIETRADDTPKLLLDLVTKLQATANATVAELGIIFILEC